MEIRKLQEQYLVFCKYRKELDDKTLKAYRIDLRQYFEWVKCQTLLGVTGSGKTFTMANFIQQMNKPTLIIAHNKTLTAQLYGEFKEFFPENAVEYFVSQDKMVTKWVIFCSKWVVEHPDVVDMVVAGE